MTKHNQFPLRGGPVWPGTNTRGGKLDDGTGQLTLNSKNVMINSQDTLEKRPGFVRGLDERFAGAVCGLHKYTDECGVEYLLVADEGGISVRKPFNIPVFEVSDAYPNDDFSGDTNTVNTYWRDPSLGYQHVDGILRIKSGAPLPLVWFKEATSQSYEVVVDFVLDPDTDDTIRIFIKSSDDDGNGSLYLEIANVGGTATCMLVFNDSTGSGSALEAGTDPATSGRALIRYDADTRKASAEVFMSGQPVELEGTLTEAQEAELGQQSMLQLVGAGIFGVDTISGAPL